MAVSRAVLAAAGVFVVDHCLRAAHATNLRRRACESQMPHATGHPGAGVVYHRLGMKPASARAGIPATTDAALFNNALCTVLTVSKENLVIREVKWKKTRARKKRARRKRAVG